MTASKRSIVAIAVLLLAAAHRPGAQVDELDGGAMHATVQTLASPDFEGRRTGTPGGLKARAWIAERYKTIGLTPLEGPFEHPFTFVRNDVEYKDAANIVGLCEGTSDAREMMVISAHYDHVGIRNGRVYPGADDNASGVAVLLALAERCRRSPFRHDALFVAFDAEELGLRGARAFLEAPPVPKEQIALNINLDMVGRSDTRELWVSGTFHWPMLRKPIELATAKAPVTVRFGHDRPSPENRRDDWTPLSDHGAFHEAGIPFVYFGVEDHADYHQPTDTAEKIDPDFLAGVAATVLAATHSLDAAIPFR